LGGATRVTSVAVVWPVSSTAQHFTDVPLDSYLRITEGNDALQPVAYRAIPFKLRPAGKKTATEG